MACLQQIQEHLAPKLILPNAADYYHDRYSEQNEDLFIIEKLSWHNIKQNNSSDKTLTGKELEYIALINGFLKNSPEAVEYFSQEYLCNRLNICERQLRRIRKNTSHVFKTKWRKRPKTYRGTLENVYAIRPTQYTVFLLKETKYYKSVKLGHQCPTSIYKDENNIKDRSNTQARESISCNNSSLVNSKKTNIPTETKELVSKKECCFENTDSNQQTSVIETKVGKFRPSKRRKKTNSEIKLKKAKSATELKPQKAKIIRPVFYSKPKSLADMHPLLDQEIYDDLRSGSGRDFSNNFIAQRLLAMSKKLNLATTNFKTRKGFIAYMSLVLKYELYDAVKTCGIDFRLRANLTADDRYAQEQERFLAGIENSNYITPEWQFKKKLVSVLSPCKAYKLLQSYIFLEINNNVLRIQLTESVELSELEKEVILNQAKAVYENTSGDDIVFIEKLEFIVTENKTPRILSSNVSTSKDSPDSNLPKGIWGDIVKKLIDEYGVHVYKNWFSKLTANVDEAVSTIELKVPSEFVKSWIEEKYMPFLIRTTQDLGIVISRINFGLV